MRHRRRTHNALTEEKHLTIASGGVTAPTIEPNSGRYKDILACQVLGG